MFGAIDGGIYLELLKRSGWMEQLKFDFPPIIYIKREFLTNCTVAYNWDNMGSMSHVDHPSFTNVRELLGSRGYIQIQRSWINGDRVLKPFYLNNMYFEEGDTFCCASAMGISYDIELRKSTSSPAHGAVSDKPLRPEENAGSTEENTPGRCKFTASLPF